MVHSLNVIGPAAPPAAAAAPPPYMLVAKVNGDVRINMQNVNVTYVSFFAILPAPGPSGYWLLMLLRPGGCDRAFPLKRH